MAGDLLVLAVPGVGGAIVLRLHDDLLQRDDRRLPAVQLRLPRVPTVATMRQVVPHGQFLSCALAIRLPDLIRACTSCFFLSSSIDQQQPWLPAVGDDEPSSAPIVWCSEHMCPIRVHWHVKTNYRKYWRVKVTVSNYNLARNYSDWNLVLQHPNLRSLTQLFSFNYRPLVEYGAYSK